MSPQDLLKKIQLFVALWRTRRFDQLAAVSAVGGASAFLWVFSGKTPISLPDPYRRIVLIVLGCFTAGCVLFLFIRLSRIQDPNAGAEALQSLPSSVRGPLPFTEADAALFRKLGRDFLIGQALAYVTNDQIPVILVSGESGVGKTSLLRAGLTAPLKDKYGRSVVYWEAKPTRPLESLTATVKDALGGTLGDASLNDLCEKKTLATRPVIVIDQLEQLSPANEAHVPVFDLIAKAAQAAAPHPATWIIAFRRDFVGIYEFLATQGLALPFLLITAFSREQAEEVMATLADKAGVSFERQLLKDFTASAAVNGAVSSVDIGIGTLVLVNLAKRAKKETITLDDYKFAGGSSGVLISYVKDQLAVYPDLWQEAVLKALLSLVDSGKNQRIAEGRSVSSLAAGSALPQGRLAVILDALAAPHIRILEKLEVEAGVEPVYRLPHERFIQPIRTLAGSLLAKESLAEYVLETGFSSWTRSRDPRLLLARKDLKQVRELVDQRSAALSADLLDYFRRSLRRNRLRTLTNSTLSFFILLILGGFTLNVQWVPQTIAETRSGKDGWVIITGFPGWGVVMTTTSGTDPNRPFVQRGPRLWRARDGKLLYQTDGMLRATCEDPPLLVVEAPQDGTIFTLDVKRLAARDTHISIPQDEDVEFVGYCEYFGYIQKTGQGNSPAHQTLHFWNTATGEPVPAPGTFDSTYMVGAYPNNDPSKSRLIPGSNPVQPVGDLKLWSIADNALVANLTRHGGKAIYFIDYPRSLVAVSEDLGNGQCAIELWDFHSGAFLRETSVTGPVTGIRLMTKGTLMFLLKGDGFASLLQVNDLSRSPLMDGKAKAGQSVGGPVWFQSGKDLVILSTENQGSLRLLGIDIDMFQQFMGNESLDAAIVLNRDGTVFACRNSTPCKPVSSGVASIGGLVWGDTVFARAKQDNSMELFSYEGKLLGRGLRGDWASAYAIARNPNCGDIFTWNSAAEIRRYRPMWTFLGRPFMDLHPGCKDL